MESGNDDYDYDYEFENQILGNNIHKLNEDVAHLSPSATTSPIIGKTSKKHERLRNQVILNRLRRDEFMKTLPNLVNCPSKSVLMKMGFRDELDVDGINQIEEIQKQCNKNKYKSFAKSIKKERIAVEKYKLKPHINYKKVINKSRKDSVLKHLKHSILQNYSNKLIKMPRELLEPIDSIPITTPNYSYPNYDSHSRNTKEDIFDKSSTDKPSEIIYEHLDEYDNPIPIKPSDIPNEYISTYNSRLPLRIVGHFSSHYNPTYTEKAHIESSTKLLDTTFPLDKTPYRPILQPQFINNNNTIVIYINAHGRTTRNLLSTEFNKILQSWSMDNSEEDRLFKNLKNMSSLETDNWLKTHYISWLLTMTGRINTTDDTDITSPQILYILNNLYKNLVLHGVPTLREYNAEPIPYIIYKSLAYALNKDNMPAEDKSYLYQHYLANYHPPTSWSDFTERVNYFLNDGGLPHILKYDIHYSSPVHPLIEDTVDTQENKYRDRVGLLFATPDIDINIIQQLSQKFKELSRKKVSNKEYSPFYLSELLALAHSGNLKIHIIDSACQLFSRNQLPKNESENIQLNNQQIYDAFESPMLYGIFPRNSNVNHTFNIKIALEHLQKTDHSLTKSNILTYTTLLEKYGHRMDYSQRSWVYEQIANLESSSSSSSLVLPKETRLIAKGRRIRKQRRRITHKRHTNNKKQLKNKKTNKRKKTNN